MSVATQVRTTRANALLLRPPLSENIHLPSALHVASKAHVRHAPARALRIRAVNRRNATSPTNFPYVVHRSGAQKHNTKREMILTTDIANEHG